MQKTKEIKIISAYAARKMFKADYRLKRSRYDMGKYAESGVGKVVDTPLLDITALYSVANKDKDGKYYALHCLSYDK